MVAKKEGNGIKPIPKYVRKEYLKKLKKYQVNSQCYLVLKHLLTEGTLTSLEASEGYGITSLPRRILDLKDYGIGIASETVVSKNRYGKAVAYAKYYLTKAV